MRCSDYVFGPLGDAIAVWVVVVACVLFLGLLVWEAHRR